MTRASRMSNQVCTAGIVFLFITSKIDRSPFIYRVLPDRYRIKRGRNRKYVSREFAFNPTREGYDTQSSQISFFEDGISLISDEGLL